MVSLAGETARTAPPELQLRGRAVVGWGPLSAVEDLADLDVAAVAVAQADDLEAAAANVGDEVLLALVVDDRADVVDVDVLGVGDPAHACPLFGWEGWTTGPPPEAAGEPAPLSAARTRRAAEATGRSR